MKRLIGPCSNGNCPVRLWRLLAFSEFPTCDRRWTPATWRCIGVDLPERVSPPLQAGLNVFLTAELVLLWHGWAVCPACIGACLFWSLLNCHMTTIDGSCAGYSTGFVVFFGRNTESEIKLFINDSMTLMKNSLYILYSVFHSKFCCNFKMVRFPLQSHVN